MKNNFLMTGLKNNHSFLKVAGTAVKAEIKRLKITAGKNHKSAFSSLSSTLYPPMLICFLLISSGCAHPIRMVNTWEKSFPVEGTLLTSDRLELNCSELSDNGVIQVQVNKVVDETQQVKVEMWGKQEYNEYQGYEWIAKPIFTPIGIVLLGAIFWSPTLGNEPMHDHNGNGSYGVHEYLYDLSSWFNLFSAAPVRDDDTKTRKVLLRTNWGTQTMKQYREPFGHCPLRISLQSEEAQKALSARTDKNGKTDLDLAPDLGTFIGSDIQVLVWVEHPEKGKIQQSREVKAVDVCQIVWARYGKEAFDKVPATKRDAIYRIYDEEARKLIGELKADRGYTRASAAVALGKLGNKLAVEPLVSYLKDTHVGTGKAAAKALGELGDPRAIEPLIATLKEGKGYLREAAAAALGKLGDRRAVKPLIAVLNDKHVGTRRAAAFSLGELGDTGAVEPLLSALRDENGYVREAAATALGELGDPRASGALRQAGNDDWEPVRVAANEALQKVPSPHPALPHVVKTEEVMEDRMPPHLE